MLLQAAAADAKDQKSRSSAEAADHGQRIQAVQADLQQLQQAHQQVPAGCGIRQVHETVLSGTQACREWATLF